MLQEYDGVGRKKQIQKHIVYRALIQHPKCLSQLCNVSKSRHVGILHLFEYQNVKNLLSL